MNGEFFVIFPFPSLFFFFHLIVEESSGRGVASSEIDAHSVASVQNNGSSKTNSRMLKQLHMNLCMNKIIPRVHLQSIIDKKNDEQYNLRQRVSEPSIATKQHVNKRKSKGQVRIFGYCDLNPYLWKKSTPTFFHEERLKSPIYKLIENNKKAMLAFQEPPNEPAAITACCVETINNKTFKRDKSQNDAIEHAASVVLFETVTLVSDDDSNNGSIDYDDKIVSYTMCQDVNMNENITITSATSASTVAEEIDDDSAHSIIVELMDCEDSSDGQNDDDDVHQPREEENAENEVESDEAAASQEDEEADREENEFGIQSDELEIIDLVEQAESVDFEGPDTIYIESPKYLPSETDGETVATPIETDSEMVAAPTETDDEIVAETTENDGEFVATPTEHVNEITAAPTEHDNEMVAAPTGIDGEVVAASTENDGEMAAAPTEHDIEMVAAPTEIDGEVIAASTGNDGETAAAPTEDDGETAATPIENNGEAEASSSAASSLDEAYLGSHRVGQLVWAQLAKFPFWPAIIHPDKEKISVKGKSLQQIVYQI